MEYDLNLCQISFSEFRENRKLVSAGVIGIHDVLNITENFTESQIADKYEFHVSVANWDSVTKIKSCHVTLSILGRKILRWGIPEKKFKSKLSNFWGSIYRNEVDPKICELMKRILEKFVSIQNSNIFLPIKRK
jgi:hypothetical protein